MSIPPILRGVASVFLGSHTKRISVQEQTVSLSTEKEDQFEQNKIPGSSSSPLHIVPTRKIINPERIERLAILRTAISYSSKQLKDAIKVHGILSALLAKDIEKFQFFIGRLKEENLQKNQIGKMPPPEWVLSKLSPVILQGLKEAGLLEGFSSKDAEGFRQEIKELDELEPILQEIVEESDRTSTFEKWKTLYQPVGEESDLRKAYYLWHDVKIMAQSKIMSQIDNLARKKYLLKNAIYGESYCYYCREGQEDLVKDLAFLPSLCEYKSVKELVYTNMIKKLKPQQLLLFESKGLIEKKNRNDILPEEKKQFVERDSCFYRFEDDVLSDVVDVVFS